MDGIHDVGGMDGFGSPNAGGHDADSDTETDDGESEDPLAGDAYEPFHDRWEGVTYSLFVATLGNGVANIDEFRHSIERMDPDRYLTARYYDRWVTGLSRLLLETDTIDAEEFWVRTAAFAAGEGTIPEREEPGLVSDLAAGVADAYGSEGEPQEPRFEAGEEVRVENVHPDGHTRCPEYVRRARGTIEAHRGTFTLPDASAHGEPAAEPLYEVAFDARELWGEEGDPNTTVTLDLWESYLAPATVGTDAESNRESEADTDDGEKGDDADNPEGTE
ncbi:nitrile hydratase subunit beta [Halobacteriales archaeon QS_3_64_16]|nr:MAG: nitrile hydratase subunit beta [Halobacteriales archaeon QS_3_64_16]